MSVYMTQFAYTPDAWAALAKKPQNRAEIFRALVERMGGKFIALYYAFGEFDGVILYEAPDETAATAIVVSAVSPGHLKSIKTTQLLTVQQAMDAMRLASSDPYPAPTGYGSYYG